MSTLLTGGTGFVGQKLIQRLKNVSITTRNLEKSRKQFGALVDQVIQWDPMEQPLTLPEGSKFDAVVNLMGESIAEGRWTKSKKQRIRDSRVEGTRRLVDALLASGQLPSVLVSASAIGFYGDSGEGIADESHSPGQGFLTTVCQQWESEAFRLTEHGVRVVCLRIGIVLGEGGGAIGKMLPLFRWGLGGKLGNGKQWMAWIHLEDLVAMIHWAIENSEVSGPVNATAPNPVRNLEFTKALASAVGRPAFLPVPKFGVRMLAGEFANSLFFSQRVIPAVALANGFQFGYSNIGQAIEDVVKS